MINKCAFHVRQKEIKHFSTSHSLRDQGGGVECSSLEGQKRRKEGRERIREKGKEGGVLVSEPELHFFGHVSRKV